jgi:hypothetical protein
VIFSFLDAMEHDNGRIGRHDWNLEDKLCLEGELAEEWHRLIGKLCSNHIKLVEEGEDSLSWLNNVVSGFTINIGSQYTLSMFHGPLKQKKCFMSSLRNNILTWDNGMLNPIHFFSFTPPYLNFL